MIVCFILLFIIFPCTIAIADLLTEGRFNINIVYIIFYIILFALVIIHVKEPRAIDVYKGKTTLEITYRDNVPVDSVVVWKK